MSSTIAVSRGELADALRAHASAFRHVGAFSACINLLMLVPAVYMLQVYDRVLPSRNTITLAMLTLLALGLYAMMALLDHVRSQLAIRIGNRLEMQLDSRVFAAAFSANLRGNRLDAGQALRDLTVLRQFVTGNGVFAFFDAPWFPLYLLVIFLFDPWLGLFALLGAALLVVLAWINERVCAEPLAAANRESIRAGALAGSQLRHAEAVAAMGMLANLQRRWFGLHEQFLIHQQTASGRAALIGAFTRATRIALQSLVLGVAALRVVEGAITPGMMIAASILMGRTLAPIEALIGAWKQWNGARLAWQRLHELLQAHPHPVAGLKLPRPAGQLQVESLCAAPPGSQRLTLANVSFAVAPGDVLGVVGASGSGKSTLARTLVGAWPAHSGVVRLDGADVHRWDRGELGPAIGYLPQSVALFPGTIGENIARFGVVDSAQIIAAARLAGVHELILQLPQGYDTLLLEDGDGLSGGQKQRIGLARALYAEPSLIVLDEPNSNLDEAGEAALGEAIASLRESKRTVVVITHRPALLSATSKVLVLRGGQMHAFGPTSQVLAAQVQGSDASRVAVRMVGRS